MDIQVSNLGHDLHTNVSLEYRVICIPVQYTDAWDCHGGHLRRYQTEAYVDLTNTDSK